MIRSESKFVREQIFFLLKLPFLLILVLFGRRKLSDLTTPLKEFVKFFLEPKLTLLLVAINIAVFILEIFYFTPEQLQQLAFRPSDFVSLNFLPIVSSWFLHASLAHLLGNMLFLLIFGRIIERRYGSARMLLIYFGSAFISSIISAIAGQGGIGASGAIAGLISVSILTSPFYTTYALGIPLPIILVGWTAIIADITGILVPMQDNIGHYAHLGGYLAISLLVFLFSKEERKKMRLGLLINAAFVIITLFIYRIV